uniref:Protein NRT1/ PTR FAMILY 5.5-like n=1 Tax=Nelumbo nucifera TaxID=4432 RepID=A0A822Y4X7_NELNU|nr:TPA_asm: hypothetical protein HUJ06_028129 [Nelumbo nucifera]
MTCWDNAVTCRWSKFVHFLTSKSLGSIDHSRLPFSIILRDMSTLGVEGKEKEKGQHNDKEMASEPRSFKRIIVLGWADILVAYTLFVMVTYLTNVWKMDFTHATAVMNVFYGVSAIMPIGMAYLVDTLVGHFWMLLVSSIAYSIGLGFLAMSTPPVLSKVTGTSSRFVKPQGSPLTHVFRVFVASTLKMHHPPNTNNAEPYGMHDPGEDVMPHTKGLRCLDKAAVVLPSRPQNGWTLCRVTEVEETKAIIRMIPMWITFAIFGVVLSFGNTYFVEQANHMNRKVGRLSFPLPIFLVFSECSKSLASNLYEKLSSDLGERRKSMPHQLELHQECCITAAKVEARRLDVIRKHGLLDKPDDTIPMSIFWLLPQFLLLGSLHGFAHNDIKDFFRKQTPNSMNKYINHFISSSFGAGSLGSVLSVYIVSHASNSKQGRRPSWFQDTLNRSRLDNYYWTLAVLSSINFLVFLLIAYKGAANKETRAGSPLNCDDDD